MARTIWKGTLSFGLVNVPVGLYTATTDRTIHFNQLQRGSSDRIRYRKVNERTGEEVSGNDIVKGFDVGGGEYVVLTDEELEAAEPERSRAIDILDFVDLADIDPIYYRTSYYLAPDGEAGARAYDLLRQAMGQSQKVAIAMLVMRNKEYLVAVRPDADVLVLETMYFADEVRSPAEELPDLPGDESFTDREENMAQLLIESMANDWDPARYHDTYRQRVEELIEQKRRGETITVEAPAPRAQVVDLMQALQASVAARTEGEGDGGASDDRAGTRSRVSDSPAASHGESAVGALVPQTSDEGGQGSSGQGSSDQGSSGQG